MPMLGSYFSNNLVDFILIFFFDLDAITVQIFNDADL